jgi:hypothetical protein
LPPSDARSRFDIVMAWSVDRLGRSLQDLIGLSTGSNFPSRVGERRI